MGKKAKCLLKMRVLVGKSEREQLKDLGIYSLLLQSALQPWLGFGLLNCR
jgi:hypothetical protein